MSDLLVVNIGTLATAEGRSARGGAAQGEVRRCVTPGCGSRRA